MCSPQPFVYFYFNRFGSLHKLFYRLYSDNPEALILADPPYYDGTDYYEDSFTLKDHRDLARLLASIKGKAMMLHSENDQIHKLYTGLGFSFKTIRTK
jgi:DNA adenine methylase